jgi:hypothetical protein
LQLLSDEATRLGDWVQSSHQRACVHPRRLRKQMRSKHG